MFFERYTNRPLIVVKEEEIIPDSRTSEEIRKRAVYGFYVRGVKSVLFDDVLDHFREESLEGKLSSRSFEKMNDLLEEIKLNAQKDGNIFSSHERYVNFAQINTYAMLLAQILFVDNGIKEGLLSIIELNSFAKTTSAVKNSLQNYSIKNEGKIDEKTATFYANLFALQVAFDKLFIPKNLPHNYNFKTGEFTGKVNYDKTTEYLALANSKVLTATPAEKRLCRNITTRWSDGIDKSSWDTLNSFYYSAISATTGGKNLFTENYDCLLEYMLPQFAYSKYKFAGEVLERNEDWPLNIIDVGAGSGAFAIDLLMTAKRLGIDAEKIRYLGIEPSEFMRKNFRQNNLNKTNGEKIPAGWELVPGSLESFIENPEQYLQGSDCVMALSYSAHHCYPASVIRLLDDENIRKWARCIYILDVTEEHGWTKPFYMWADCESPENFGSNIKSHGIWKPSTLWLEPSEPLENSALTNAWCSLRLLERG